MWLADISFWDAVGKWWQGFNVSQEVMWGHSIYIWARVGKIAMFVAASPLVAELIGYRRISRCAATVLAYDPPNRVVEFFHMPRFLAQLAGGCLGVILVGTIVVAVISKWLGHQLDLNSFCGCWGLAFLLFVLLVGVSELARAVAHASAWWLSGLAQFLQGKTTKRRILLVAVLLLIAGSCLDILGS